MIWSIWWGGLTFYALVVVPKGTEQIGSLEQGFITQKVTLWHNVFSVLMILALARESIRVGSRVLALECGILAILTILLVALHAWLTTQMDPSNQALAIGFYQWHATYLWLTATEWFLGLSLPWLFLTGMMRDS